MKNNTEVLINILKKFPDKNPNPVIQISDFSVLEYFNNPSKEIIEFYGFRINEKINGLIEDHIKKTMISNEHSFEITINTQTFYFSAIYTAELKLINMYGTNITAKKVIDKFPDSNPNPVLRIDLNGVLNYFNKASTYLVKELSIGLNNKIPKIIFNNISNQKEKFELEIGEKHYLFHFVKIHEFNFYLLYGTDITDTKDKERILNKLSKYFSPQVYSSIFSGALDVTINTSRKNLTVFFSDIKGFTTITEKLEPEILTQLITSYLTKMTDIAIEYGGTVDKYIGDAIMIFFGDPESKGVKEDATSCVLMAMEMKKALVELRKNWELAGVSESLDVRMGVHSDMCTVGNFGSLDRLDYTVLGNGVNLASRLESLADSNQILISENTYNLIKKEINCNYFDSLTVKGKAHSIKTFQVIGTPSDKKSFSKISTSKEGFILQIDKSKIKDVDEVLQLLKDSIEELNK
ncbi:adenylate/guanylate cyclase domain-containing protein [Candidatus Marinimicrobia bacterium]|nr:adenylate/guanylate cyclase domain-containing protein [Candidatus Neomarinimicrobiota bacterium]MDC0384239.1 adenylate/guanylate cyclase domain-containing protein [Candidatus Neomarinimicrobiota bacterium]